MDKRRKIISCIATLALAALTATDQVAAKDSPPSIRPRSPVISSKLAEKIKMSDLKVVTFVKDRSQTKLIVRGPDQSDNYKLSRVVTTLRFRLVNQEGKDLDLPIQVPYLAACNEARGVSKIERVIVKQDRTALATIDQDIRSDAGNECEKAFSFNAKIRANTLTSLTVLMEYDVIESERWLSFQFSGFEPGKRLTFLPCTKDCTTEFSFQPAIMLINYENIEVETISGSSEKPDRSRIKLPMESFRLIFHYGPPSPSRQLAVNLRLDD